MQPAGCGEGYNVTGYRQADHFLGAGYKADHLAGSRLQQQATCWEQVTAVDDLLGVGYRCRHLVVEKEDHLLGAYYSRRPSGWEQVTGPVMR